MCGILMQLDKIPIDKKKFERSLDLQINRGPDNKGIKYINSNFALGHLRLSIQDLSELSNQPMTDKDGYTLIFNGEIYNFHQLKNELIQKGENFVSNGDTEVLLKLLKVFGIKGIEKLNGMWAFIFIDHNSGLIIISRDRFGKKPLYYFQDNKKVIFSSEIKSIFSLTNEKRILNKGHIEAFVKNTYWKNDSKETFYSNILQVLPGEILTTNYKKNQLIFNHCNINNIENFEFKDSKNFTLNDIISDSISLRLISDVKNCVFLSGGVDSSLIAGEIVKTNKNIEWLTGETVDGNDNFYVDKLSNDLKIKVDRVPINYGKEMVKRIKKMTKQYEIPVPFLGNSIGMNIMYEYASMKNIKVIIDGTGGDEIFGGYFDYYFPYILNTYIQKNGLIGLFNALKDVKPFQNIKYKLVMKLIFESILKNYFKNKNSKNLNKLDLLTIENFQVFDAFMGRLQMWLRMNDLNSMMHSVESRSPFLDVRLSKYIKDKKIIKYKNGYNKFSLRLSMPKNISSKIRWRKDKQGFRYSGFRFYNQNIQSIKKIILDSELISKNYNFSKDSLNHFSQLNLNYYMIAMLENEYECSIN